MSTEDSRTGLLTAKAAALFCVAVPTKMTRQLEVSEADPVTRSLREVTLDELLMAELPRVG